MGIQLITRGTIGQVPAVSTGADINKGTSLTQSEYDQNLVNIRDGLNSTRRHKLHTVYVAYYGLGIALNATRLSWADYDMSGGYGAGYWYQIGTTTVLGWVYQVTSTKMAAWATTDANAVWIPYSGTGAKITDPPYIVGSNNETVLAIVGSLAFPMPDSVLHANGGIQNAGAITYVKLDLINNSIYKTGDEVAIYGDHDVVEPILINSLNHNTKSDCTTFQIGLGQGYQIPKWFPYIFACCNYYPSWTLVSPNVFCKSYDDFSGWGNSIQATRNGVLQRFSLSQAQYENLTSGYIPKFTISTGNILTPNQNFLYVNDGGFTDLYIPTSNAGDVVRISMYYLGSTIHIHATGGIFYKNDSSIGSIYDFEASSNGAGDDYVEFTCLMSGYWTVTQSNFLEHMQGKLPLSKVNLSGLWDQYVDINPTTYYLTTNNYGKLNIVNLHLGDIELSHPAHQRGINFKFLCNGGGDITFSNGDGIHFFIPGVAGSDTPPRTLAFSDGDFFEIYAVDGLWYIIPQGFLSWTNNEIVMSRVSRSSFAPFIESLNSSTSIIPANLDIPVSDSAMTGTTGSSAKMSVTDLNQPLLGRPTFNGQVYTSQTNGTRSWKSITNSPVRQTVLSGGVNYLGAADFIKHTTNLTKGMLSSAIPLNDSSGAPFDFNTNHVWFNNGVATYGACGKSGFSNCVILNGTNQWLDTAASTDYSFGSEDFTVECYFQRSAIGVLSYMAGTADSAAAGANVSFLIRVAATNIITCEVYSGSTATATSGTQAITSIGTWYHLAFVRLNGRLRLYLDGRLQGVETQSPLPSNSSTYKLSVGRLGELNSGYFAGKIMQFRIVKGECLYPTEFSPPSTPFSNSLSLIPVLSTASTPVVLSFANGFDSDGAHDEISVISADTNFPTLPVNSTVYLYADREPSDGSITLGYELDPPVYYFGTKELYNAVPTMTSDTVPSGVASASSFYSGSVYAWSAFNGIPGNNYWETAAATATGWLKYKFVTAKIINGYSLRMSTGYPTQSPRNWTFEGSNTGLFSGEQTILDTRTGESWLADQEKTFAFSNGNAYLYYRINVTLNNGGATVQITEMRMFSAVDNYDIRAAKMYVRSGTTFMNKQRLYIGEATTDGTKVISTSAYAIQGIYEAVSTSIPLAGQTSNYNHNIGAKNCLTSVFLVNVFAESGFLQGDRLLYTGDGNSGSGSAYYGIIPRITRSSMLITAGANGLGGPTAVTGALGALFTAAYWRIGFTIKRAW